MDRLREGIRDALTEGPVAGVMGLILDGGHPRPHLFTKGRIEDLDRLVVGEARYPLAAVLLKVLRNDLDAHLGIVARGCDERAILELVRNVQLNGERVVVFGVACSSEQASACQCPQPYPSSHLSGERVAPVSDSEGLDRLDRLSEEERLQYWMDQFGKCIKCYGCRNICPMCFCTTCTLDEDDLIQTGTIPPEKPIFHLIRAFHMAERCIDCGLCEAACPSGIPLRTLYKKMRNVVTTRFGFTPGITKEGKGPLQYLGDGKFGEQEGH
ncbi:MAG: 4Fe-4S binding protein [Thermodesulfobacteriota bacterium]